MTVRMVEIGRVRVKAGNAPIEQKISDVGTDCLNRNVRPQFGYWLGTRAKHGFGTQPSTWQNGLDDSRKVL
jgi:hypothetical protein